MKFKPKPYLTSSSGFPGSALHRVPRNRICGFPARMWGGMWGGMQQDTLEFESDHLRLLGESV